MSTFKSPITIPPNSRDEIIPPLLPGSGLPLVKERERQGASMKQYPAELVRRVGAFIRECLRRMRIMNTAFEQAESGNGAMRKSSAQARHLHVL